MRKLTTIGVTGKLGAAFGVMLITAGLTASITWWRSNAAVETTATASQLRQGLERLGAYKKSIDAATGAVRAFLLTGDRSLLARYEAAAAEHKTHLAALQQTDMLASASVESVEAAFGTWRSTYAERQIKLMRDPGTVDLARAIESTGEPQMALDEAEAQMQSVRKDLFERVAAAGMEQQRSLQILETVALASGGVSLALTLLFAWLSYRMISRPTQTLAQTTMALADGNLDVDVPNTGRGDEIGAVSSALLVFRNNLLEARKTEERSRESEAAQAKRRREEMNGLADEFEANVKRLVTDVATAVGALSDSSQKLSEVADETTKQVEVVQEASKSAAASVNTVASATEELSSSVGEVANQAGTSSKLVAAAADSADRTNADMAKLSQAIAQISEVTTLIQDIAEQTNLLALNATIEAARAGEAGKGFAVVASEVKELASQTGKATERIDQQVQEIQETATQSLEGVQKIAEHLSNMTDAASAVAATAEQQGAATSDIASSAGLASQGTGQVTDSIDSIRGAATQTSQVSDEFRTAAQQLREQAGDLNRSVDAFIDKVRAA